MPHEKQVVPSEKNRPAKWRRTLLSCLNNKAFYNKSKRIIKNKNLRMIEKE